MKKSLLTLVSFYLVLSSAWAVKAWDREDQPREVTVTSTWEFLEAIAPNTTIFIEMSEIDPIIFSDSYPDSLSPYCGFEYAYDGQQLLIHDVEGLSIIGTQRPMSRILTPYSYANVIWFRNCSDLTLQWLNCGHEVEGYCTGGVLGFENCRGVSINNCDLWGCGIEGINIVDSSEIICSHTTIRDCSYSIMSVYNSSNILFEFCRMHDNREFDMLNFIGSDNVWFENCVIWNNQSSNYYGSNLINAVGTDVTFYQCAIFGNNVEYLTNEDADVEFDTCIMFDNQPSYPDY